MCLTAKKNWFQRKLGLKFRLKTAKKDIHVYKMLNTSYAGNGQWHLSSPFRYTPYQLDVLYKAELDVHDLRTRVVVEAGLHAFTSPEKAEHVSNSFRSINIYPAIIPKGSKYIIGDDGDIVSNQLIVKSNIKKCQ